MMLSVDNGTTQTITKYHYADSQHIATRNNDTVNLPPRRPPPPLTDLHTFNTRSVFQTFHHLATIPLNKQYG